MEALIPVMNKLQDIFNAIGTDVIQLPQIVVVGTQSSGKSSVLESLVGRDFLPRGTGIVTRCPLVLQLIHTLVDDTSICPSESLSLQFKEWGKFLHTQDKIYYDFDEICKEIEAETKRKTGSDKGISTEPINLKIYSPFVVNLTLVDLPGIMKIPIGDQPEDIENQVRQLILQHISNPNAIILAVTAANTDFVTSESLKLARECDIDGNRTIAVITKLDLMDAGTDAIDVLCGRIIPVKLGIIGVVNRSQQDIVNKKNIQEAIKEEALFLQKKYPTLAAKNGIPYLSKTLNKLLMNHIRESLPSLKMRINHMISQYQALLHSYGEIVTDPGQKILEIITLFANTYCSTIDGTSKNIETSELCGGARISYIFHETFGRTLNQINPLSGLSTWDILTAIKNTTGTRPTLFVPEVTFELLVKRQIRRLEDPSLRCVQLVYEEMIRIIEHCGDEFHQDIIRFPKLHEKVRDVLTQLLRQRLPSTNTMIQNLVAIELAYINTKHPDFHDTSFTDIFSNELEDNSQSHKYHHNACISPGNLRKFDEDVVTSEKIVNSNCEPKGNTKYTESNLSTKSFIENGCSQQITGIMKHHNFDKFSKVVDFKMSNESLGGKSCCTPVHKSRHISPLTFENLLSAAHNTRSRQLSEKEKKDCKIIERLIYSYFTIVKKTIQDSVPKAIMHFFVNYVRHNLQSQLVSHLYKRDIFLLLLEEAEHITTGRKEAAEMIEALDKANQVISEIRDTYLF